MTDAYKTGWKHGHADKLRGAENRSQWFTTEDEYSRGYRDGYSVKNPKQGTINTMKTIEKLTAGMDAARTSADGQEREGYIILTREAYEKLYYAALDAKKILVALKGVL